MSATTLPGAISTNLAGTDLAADPFADNTTGVPPSRHTSPDGLTVTRRADVGVIAAGATEFWKHLPGYYYLFCTFDFLFAELAFFPQKPWNLVPGLIFPLTMGLAYFYARLKLSSASRDNARRYFGLVVTASLAFVALLIALTPTIPLAHNLDDHYDLLKLRHEFVTLLWIPLIAAHCFWNKGAQSFTIFYVAALIYGIAQETGGVMLGYFAESGYHLYLPFIAAPVTTAFGWSTVYYPVIAIFEMYRRAFPAVARFGVIASAATVALMAASFDLHLDAMATGIGLWVWHEAYYATASTIFLFGVPILNFFAWFWAVSSFALVYFFIEHHRPHMSGLKRGIIIALLVGPIQWASGIGFFSTMFLIEGGINGPTGQVLRTLFEHGFLWH